jgi:DNA invertase Pin-like site-specific DNA recombinase
MIVGYVRVSSVEQNEGRQLVTMEKLKVEKVFSKKSVSKKYRQARTKIHAGLCQARRCHRNS